MNIREYISLKNLSGVQSFASKNGLNIPSNTNEAYILLTDIYNSDKELAKTIFKELHPDLFLFSISDSLKRNACGCGEEKRNACGCSGGHRNADGLDSAINRVEIAGKDTLRDIKEAIKERDDRLLKYGLVLIAGVLVGKYLIK